MLDFRSSVKNLRTKPPAYDRQGLAIDDLIDFTPELRAEAVEIVSRYTIGPIFTPPVVSRWEGPPATLSLPGAGGGSNWPGGSLFMPAPQSGSPMTYMLDGEQYIVLAVSGSNYSGALLAFKLN